MIFILTLIVSAYLAYAFSIVSQIRAANQRGKGMNSRIQKWKAALLSGEFKQAKHFLREDGGFCCLGVACEIYRRETGKGEWVTKEYDDKGDVLFFNANTVNPSAMPSDVFCWYGLREPNPIIIHLRETLASMNDAGKTFAEIADVLPDGKPDEELESEEPRGNK